MDVYLSEEEQLRRIKEWWQKHSNMLLTIVAIVMAILAGWRLWHRHELKLASQASIVYAQMLNADFAKQRDDFNLYAKRLMNDYSATPYASLAAMLAAKNYMQTDDVPQAIDSLKWAIKHGEVASIVDIASIRLARILLTKSQNKAALAVLQKVKTKKMMAVKYELIGDAWRALGNDKIAQENYHHALNTAKDNNMNTTLLHLKMA